MFQFGVEGLRCSEQLNSRRGRIVQRITSHVYVDFLAKREDAKVSVEHGISSILGISVTDDKISSTFDDFFLRNWSRTISA